jgi:hypothetical protein
LLRNGAQNIARPRNIGEVNLCLDAIIARRTARGLCRTWRGVGTAAKMFTHQIRFVIFERAGMRFLFRYTDRGQNIKNFPALDFQFTGQIVNSNLAHPLIVSYSFLLISYL